MSTAPIFPPDDHGYLRHWLIAGPIETPYTGPTQGGDDAMRRGAIDPTILPAPQAPALGGPAPRGATWALHDPGRNVFIERSSFWFTLMHVDTWFAAELHAEQAMTLPAWLWAAGCADLYCNGTHIVRNNCWRYMYPQRQRVELPLVQGVNRLAVRLQVLGLRDSRYLFGLQCVDPSAPVTITRPGQNRPIHEGTAEAAQPKATDSLLAATQPADTTRTLARGSGHDFETRRRTHMHAAMDSGEDKTLAHGLLCARSIGVRRDSDEQTIADICQNIDGRPDCAEFALAALLRLVALDLVSDAERQRIKHTAIHFRYWTDEAGVDAMCFTSENHQIAFHSGQVLAGRLWPDEWFSASCRYGRQQIEIGLARCRDWLDRIETRGFHEYLSSGYMSVTSAALMNLVDAGGDEAIAGRAAAVVDSIFRMIADHAFDGIVITPQARVYRQVLQPEGGGTQAMLSYAMHDAVVAHNIWLGFLASSPSYQPPGDLVDRAGRPVSKRYMQNGVGIVLHKTGDYILTSVEVGSALPPADDPSLDHERGMHAGLGGYQQHLWQATLGGGCHVFVNHPGEWIDMGHARPGYWYGNGVLPRTEQRDHVLMQIYSIHDEHPVPFAHAHWPADVFDETTDGDGWHVARRGSGYVGLWCSEPLENHDQVLIGRELRANAQQSAWVCVCGSTGDHADLAAFAAHCRSLVPRFDRDELALQLAGDLQLDWN